MVHIYTEKLLGPREGLISEAYFFVPDQSDKQALEMRFCSKTVLLIKLTGQIIIFTDHNS